MYTVLGWCFPSLLGTYLTRQEDLELRGLASCFLVPSWPKHLFLSSCFLWLLEHSWRAGSGIDHCSFFHCFSGRHSVWSPWWIWGCWYVPFCMLGLWAWVREVRVENAWQTHCFTLPGATSQSPSGPQYISNSNKLLSSNSDPPLIEFVPTGLKAGLVPLITQTPFSCRDLLLLC